MPHATNGTMSQDQLTNGETPSSKFLSHVTSYPMVNDGIETFKQHPVGKKSLEIADGAYQRVGKPVEPYLQQGFNYVKPYYERADEMADSGLGHVDHRFPIVKEDTHTVIDTAKSYAFWPYNYVWSTWNGKSPPKPFTIATYPFLRLPCRFSSLTKFRIQMNTARQPTTTTAARVSAPP